MMLEKAGEVCLTGTVWKGVVASVFCATAWLYLSGKTFESYLIAHMNPKDSYPRARVRIFDLKHSIPPATVAETDGQFQVVLVFGDSRSLVA